MLLAATSMLAACSDDETVEEVSVITLDHELYECGKEGGTVDVTVTSMEDWTLEGYCYWAVPSVTEGKSGDVVTFTVEENWSLQDLETEYLFVAGDAVQPFTIRQSKGEYIEDAISLSETNKVIGSDGGTFEIEVTSSKGWSCTDSNSWCHVSQTKGQNGDKVSFTIDPHYTGYKRNFNVTFKRGYASVVLYIEQQKRESTPNDIVLSESTANIGYEGGTCKLTVVSALYDWTMQNSYANWCNVDLRNGTKDEQNVEFTYTIEPNYTAYSRTCTTTFRAGPTSKTFKVVQAACPKSPEDVVLSCESFDVPAEGGTVQVVLESVKYDWTMTTYPPSGWVLDNSTRSGTKDDKNVVFNFTIPASTAPRNITCNMTFKAGPTSKTVRIVQAAPAN